MEESFRLGNVAGIRVGVNWSLLVVFWLISLGLADGRFPEEAPGSEPSLYWAAALTTAALFYAALLAHELSHALVARQAGVGVEGITLWLFGGMTKMRAEAHTPQVELRVAVAGPLVSLAVAGVMATLALVADAAGASSLVVAMASWLARINLILAAFNLVPAAPLDGGRVLRSILWRRHGDQLRATVTAARAGRLFGYLLVAAGLLEFAAGAGIGGLWFLFLGWFLIMAARAEETAATLRGALGGVTVGDVMTPDPVVAPGWLTLDAFLEEYVLRHRFSAFPIESFDGRLDGLVTLQRLKQVPGQERAKVRAHDVAWRIEEVPSARPDEPLVALLRRMGGSSEGRALVLEGERLVGIVTPTDVARAVEVATLGGRAGSNAAEADRSG
ncbi:MAG: site-2 protease family protein [Actinomycetota bacterium]|nr:site-2 protease family protein [Actinomycetota bacterium]